jgi:L-alanine-DL-glutamate epimerase-like enolase superfamily enzyme
MNNSDTIKIRDIKVECYQVPTDFPESDGTLAWNGTTLIFVEVFAGGFKGIGYTYASTASADIINNQLKYILIDANAMDLSYLYNKMNHEIRNLGRQGVVSSAISAVDCALWDLKAKIFEIPLAVLLGKEREKIAVYGSGGFTSYNNEQIKDQFAAWMKLGIKMFKMKIGREKNKDWERIKEAREIIGPDNELFVDANGAYYPDEACYYAEKFNEFDVRWFEEPVSSDNLEGLNFVRNHVPPQISIAAGEYGYDLLYFNKMLRAGAVDVLQADATRCGGLSGFIKAGILCETYQLPFSAHTSPLIHLHPMLCLKNAVHIEYFYDHERIEKLFFDGFIEPDEGFLKIDMSRPGLGIELKKVDAEKYLI